MKIQSTNLLSTLSSQEVKQLTTTVEETLALNIVQHKKVFTAADLWDIQRRRKTISTRRFA